MKNESEEEKNASLTYTDLPFVIRKEKYHHATNYPPILWIMLRAWPVYMARASSILTSSDSAACNTFCLQSATIPSSQAPSSSSSSSLSHCNFAATSSDVPVSICCSSPFSRLAASFRCCSHAL
ncbi:hypothetical protein MUK42_35248 [Musa troglodytarum]|uniref:Uncharacterized protein n=1 Tax=Musa troglodytarum TaxID=320322 RepID=A0A9E7JBY8_9LILI|nr:hypothetical protein MUK42_35248 [Musa troglodytarum]